MKGNDNTRVQGLLDAVIIVGEMTGRLRLGEISEDTWRLICEINIALLRKAAEAIDDAEDD